MKREIILFYRFLDKERIRYRFLNAFNNTGENSFHHYRSLEDYLNFIIPRAYISDAFSWSRQGGGVSYWVTISSKWHSYLDKPDISLTDNIKTNIKLL